MYIMFHSKDVGR